MGGSRASINQAVAAVRDDGGVRMEEAGLPRREPHHSTDHLDARGGALALEKTEVPDRNRVEVRVQGQLVSSWGPLKLVKGTVGLQNSGIMRLEGGNQPWARQRGS